MPCRQVPTFNGVDGVGKPDGSGFDTQEECLEACQEGACCKDSVCTIKPQCQCQGVGMTFQGIGTTCNQEGTLGRCCFYNRQKATSGYFTGEPNVEREYCESLGGTWYNACGVGCTTDCKTGVNCDCMECGKTAPNPLP